MLRVRIAQSVTTPIAFFPFTYTVTTKQVAFVTACLGEVAHVSSLQDEASDDFTRASRLWRVGLAE